MVPDESGKEQQAEEKPTDFIASVRDAVSRAFFLVNEGIRSSSKLFGRIEEIIAQITALRQQLSAIVAEETDLGIS
jgi:tRNA-dihydrouridine synthase